MKKVWKKQQKMDHLLMTLMMIFIINNSLASNPIKLETAKSHVGIIGRNLTLTWKYMSQHNSLTAEFLVSLPGTNLKEKICVVTYSKDTQTVKKIYSSKIPEIKMLNNKTTFEVKNITRENEKNGLRTFLFHLHIESLSKSIAANGYVCTVRSGLWYENSNSTSIKLAEPPVVNFTMTENGEPVLKGGHVEMFCQAVGFPVPHVHLKRVIDTKHITLGTSIKNLSFSISNVQPSDKGKYICSATNIAGTRSKEIDLSVKYLDSNMQTDNKLFVEKGGNLSLQCNIIGYPEPTFSWYFGTNKMKDTNRVLTLEFKDATQFDTYRCKAENAVDSLEAKFHVEEAYIKVINFVTNQKANIKDVKNLECPIIGNPNISYSWFKDSRKLADTRLLKLILSSNEDFGTYKCLGRNTAGTKEVYLSFVKAEKEKEKPKEQKDKNKTGSKETGSNKTGANKTGSDAEGRVGGSASSSSMVSKLTYLLCVCVVWSLIL